MLKVCSILYIPIASKKISLQGLNWILLKKIFGIAEILLQSTSSWTFLESMLQYLTKGTNRTKHSRTDQAKFCINNICILGKYRSQLPRQLIFISRSYLKTRLAETLMSLSFLQCLFTAQKIKFFIKDFFSKCDQIRSFLQIWTHLLKKSLMENFSFYAVVVAIPW